jgi:hypothetical protein
MNTKKTAFAAIAAIGVALSLAGVVPALTNQAFAQDFPGSNGQGHQEDTGCTQGPDRDECPGQSGGQNPNRDDCEVVFAGNSDNIKFEDPEGCSEDL